MSHILDNEGISLETKQLYGLVDGFDKDFIDFYFNGAWASSKGITRVSGGDRYTELLTATYENVVTDVPNGDGVYYFGTKFKNYDFEVNVAFDHITEKQLRELRQWLSTTKPQRFYFWERPYKGYLVKLADAPQFEYIGFDEFEVVIENDTEQIKATRIYKGEVTLSFISIGAFGESEIHFGKIGDLPAESYGISNTNVEIYALTNSIVKSQYVERLFDIDDLDVWFESTEMPKTQARNFDDYNITTSATISSSWYPTPYDEHVWQHNYQDTGTYWYSIIQLKNAGDRPFDFMLELAKSDTNSNTIKGQKLSLYLGNCGDGRGDVANGQFTITWSDFTLTSGDSGARINTKNHLIEGYDSNGNLTGTVYNQFITAGNFFQIPKGIGYGDYYYLVFTGNGDAVDETNPNGYVNALTGELSSSQETGYVKWYVPKYRCKITYSYVYY